MYVHSRTFSALYSLRLLFAPSFVIQSGHPLMCTSVYNRACTVTILCTEVGSCMDIETPVSHIWPVEQRFGHNCMLCLN